MKKNKSPNSLNTCDKMLEIISQVHNEKKMENILAKKLIIQAKSPTMPKWAQLEKSRVISSHIPASRKK